jgi:hypothetical protein
VINIMKGIVEDVFVALSYFSKYAIRGSWYIGISFTFRLMCSNRLKLVSPNYFIVTPACFITYRSHIAFP